MSQTSSLQNTESSNPLLTLSYEPAMESLGDDYYDVVAAAKFPKHILRFRNDQLLPLMGLDSQTVTDTHFIEAFGKFEGREPLLALRYHGYQFGEYNPFLGDGRGFLYGQIRGTDGELYDFGTKGSGTTPYSRGGDGRLTLKGGVREVLAGEALYQMGVRTSRCLSMIETGDSLWRGDEPSPTRSSVMVRFSRSHIRFGTFERLHYLGRKDLTKKLLDYVIEYYYPHLQGTENLYGEFYAELVKRVAELVAQWMAAGFCHAVLNTDNMSITGESFDYGPYAFIPTYKPDFTAAYFDYYGRYSYGNQAMICRLNLEMLQQPLASVIPMADMEAGLAQFFDYYYLSYRDLMLKRLGFDGLEIPEADDLLNVTIEILKETQVGYNEFFAELRQQFFANWREDASQIFNNGLITPSSEQISLLDKWRNLYHCALNSLHPDEMGKVAQMLRDRNPITVIVRPVIESIWEPITKEDNWEPFYDLLNKIRSKN
ncbi:MAG TPA: YdiU family protein [Leptolyngbyaceae cyanobacterium]